MSKLTTSFKGQISKETEKAIEITVIKGDELFSTWLPKSALNMKEMPVDCLSKEGVQIFHIHQWAVDMKKEAKPSDESTKAEEYETRTLSKDTETVDMPFNPNAVTKSQGEFNTVLLEQILTATIRVGDLLEAMMKK